MKKFRLETTSASLHIMAMFFMLLDHMWATILAYDWMTCVGRIAFPIFAFMLAEGFKRTKNLKKYALRLLIFAIVSEIPFNLMYGNQLFYPMHQNVMWTFLIAIGGMTLMEKAKSKDKLWLTILVTVLVCIAGLILGYVLFVDYYGCGILTVFIFYIFDRDHEKNIVSRILKDNKYKKQIWTIVCLIGQFVCLYYINVEILGGFYYNVTLFGFKFELIQQALALLALIPIWLYRGKQGYHATWFKYFNYAFYPVHCLILALLAIH
ncbi:MAG: conjugal transfer protein TraX [Clostridia bacterium]|nr:conjugal transfer protein TraX [Clostridia bacterium]